MIRWIPYTFVRTTMFLMGGVVLGIFYPDFADEDFVLILLFSLLAFYLVLFFAERAGKKIPFNPGYVVLPAVFLAGFIHTLNQTGSRSRDHVISLQDTIRAYRVTVVGYAEEKEKSWKMTGAVTAVRTREWIPAEGKVMLYFRKEDFKQPFNYGDVLMLRNGPSPVLPPGNPGEFDYKRFLAYRNVYHQHFVRGGEVQYLGQEIPNYFRYHALKARLWANDMLHRYVNGNQEQAVASALILGVTDGLDNELLSAYASTGAMHVLAVSGLHVSIIYIIILFLFKPVTMSKKGKRLVVILSLLLLWGYAFVTGLSPSVLRAVTMFSFLAIANATARQTNIYNTLAASAFCLLLFDPFLIMSVGFQLSYLAVIGILYIHPLLYRLWEPATWLMNEVWKITSVSIAAQLATFSLGLFYFHQFPNYFLLSNLLVIPLSFVVLILGLALLLSGIIPLIASVLGVVLQFVIKLLNLSVIAVEWLPFSLVENIHITAFQCWLLIGITVCMLLVIQRRDFVYFRISFFFCLAYTAAQWSHFAWWDDRSKITVYRISGHSAIDLISDGTTYFIGDSTLENGKISFHMKPNRVSMGVRNVVSAEAFPLSREIRGGRLMVWKDKSVLCITRKDFIPSREESADIVIIANNTVDPKMLNRFSPQTILVFDSSNSASYLKKIEGAPTSSRIHSVLRDGAFEWITGKNTWPT